MILTSRERGVYVVQKCRGEVEFEVNLGVCIEFGLGEKIG